MWSDVLKTLGSTAVVLAVLGFVARSIFLNWLNKDTEQYKQEMLAAHEMALEQLRNELRLKSFEHETRFRSIYAKQATVLTDTYAKLDEVHRSVASYVKMLEYSDEPSKEEKLERVKTAYEEFRTCFYPQRIFFPKDTRERVKELSDKFVSISNIFTSGQRRDELGVERAAPDSPSEADLHGYWDKTNEMLKKEIPPLLEQLEDDFQKLLGVDSSQRKTDSQEST